MSYITRRDAENALNRYEGQLDDLGNAEITEISSAYEDLRDSFSDLESELNYVLAEHEEYEDALEAIDSVFGTTDADELEELAGDRVDPDELDALSRQCEELKEANEALRSFSQAQGRVITALLDKIVEVHRATSEEAINQLVFNAASENGSACLLLTDES